jgi:thiol-disulfide isomerase/thioredoxin
VLLVLGAVGILLAPSSLSSLAPASGEKGEGEGAKIGDRIDNLTFKDTRYLPRSLDDFEKKKAFVLVFTTTGCPLVERYLPALQRLEKEYRGRGVQFLAVNVGADDSIVAMAAQGVEHDMEFPFVKDFDGKCAAALGVKRTPEVALLDAERRLRYRGRIDDQYRLSGARSAPTRHDLKEALDAVLAGREVAVRETPVDGCLITRPTNPPPAQPVTFAEHIAPLLQKHCQDCHRPEASAPFALVTYRQVTARAEMIAEVVAEQRMPPWYASPNHGSFTNRRGLTPAERETFLHWLRSGMPRGDEAKLPRPRPDVEKPSKWLMGEPDLIIKAPEHELPAEGDVDYKYVVLPHVFLHDTWIQGVQILPDNPKVVHHCNMAYGTAAGGVKKQNFITGLVPGNPPMMLEEGMGFRIPAGSVLALEIHYVTTGKPERCRISVGLRHARGTVQKQLQHLFLEDVKFTIPPGAPAHRVVVNGTLEHDALVVGMFAHMHLRGRDMSFRAHTPDGKSETLLVIPNYSFDWQMPYVIETGKKRLPKGTRIECIAHYDNSPFNAFNPNPTAAVRFGLQTRDEMFNGFFFYVDEHEQLNLEIDPKTGKARPK